MSVRQGKPPTSDGFEDPKAGAPSWRTRDHRGINANADAILQDTHQLPGGTPKYIGIHVDALQMPLEV